MAISCYHCGEAIPAGTHITVTAEGVSHPVCCHGCEAVFQFIHEAGLGSYYRHRSVDSLRPDDPVNATLDGWRLLDDRPEMWGEDQGDGSFEILWQVEGIHCAACAWLIRRRLQQRTSVRAVHVDVTAGYLRVEWKPSMGRISALAEDLVRLGFVPHLPWDRSAVQARRKAERRLAQRLGLAGLGMMQVMMYAVGLYLGPGQGIDATSERVLQWASLVITTPIVLFSAYPFFLSAARSLQARSLGMDVPIALAITAAYLASTWNFFRGSGEIYFDSVVMFVFFLLVARYVEMRLRHRNLDTANALARLVPEWALRLVGERVQRVPTRDLAVGDRVRVTSGAAVPADATLQSGSALVNESLLTGESRPVVRQQGEALIAGSVILEQPCEVVVTATGENTTVSALGRMIMRSRTGRRPAGQWGSSIAGRFVAAVLVLAALTGLGWALVQPNRAFTAVLAVLVASCPCALALALPAARAAASRAILKRGLLLTNPDALVALAKFDAVAFDKTGTLTAGHARLSECELNPDRQDWNREAALGAAAALESHSGHPLAEAFRDINANRITLADVSVHPGEGVEASLNGQRVAIGQPAFALQQPAPDWAEAWPVGLADERGWIARFRFSDAIRPSAEALAGTLHQAGIPILVLSGDHQAAVQRVADRLHIASAHARLTPAAKMEHLAQLQANGKTVLMIGDGVNDAPVLAAADVSIAVHGGADLAAAAADMVTVDASLNGVMPARHIAARAMKIARQNTLWAVVYNLAAMPMAALGLLPPWAAALGMSLSSLLVVGNAARVAR